MREILFRGKNKVDGEWSIGSLTHDTKYGNCFIEVCVHQGICEEVIPETVGEYTGLIDKNNKKIFEHDIVKAYDPVDEITFNGVVKYFEGSFYICDKDFCSYYCWIYYKVEVIGNIFDNPELLKKE